MAPLATRHPFPGQTAQDFEAVRDALPEQQSPYEIIWLDNVPQQDRATYPSSFVLLGTALSTWCSVSMMLTQYRPSASGWIRSIPWKRRTNCILAIGEIVFASPCPQMWLRI
jgi:hypothetical protein